MKLSGYKTEKDVYEFRKLAYEANTSFKMWIYRAIFFIYFVSLLVSFWKTHSIWEIPLILVLFLALTFKHTGVKFFSKREFSIVQKVYKEPVLYVVNEKGIPSESKDERYSFDWEVFSG